MKCRWTRYCFRTNSDPHARIVIHISRSNNTAISSTTVGLCVFHYANCSNKNRQGQKIGQVENINRLDGKKVLIWVVVVLHPTEWVSAWEGGLTFTWTHIWTISSKVDRLAEIGTFSSNRKTNHSNYIWWEGRLFY